MGNFLRMLMLTILLLASWPGFAADTTALVPGNPPTALIGTWYSVDGSATFNADGTMITNGQNYYYVANNGMIQIVGSDGVFMVSYQLSGGSLTVVVNGRETVYYRKPVAMDNNVGNSNNRAGGISKELLLSSAWCTSKYSQISGRLSSSRVQLRPDGTYSTSGQRETNMSTNAGNYFSAGNSSGGGRWQVVNGELFISEGNGNMVPVQTRIVRNSNGYPIVVANGIEYYQCE